jgi:Na+-transporting NADH:ubiquinone oxidoreductase subunit F
MSTAVANELNQPTAKLSDYSLIGRDTQRAIELGLAEATWYTSPVPKDKLRELLTRKDWPAIRDSVIYFGLIFATGYATYGLWGSWWALLPMMIYGVLYASASDSRWHESGHGTAFKTDWLNNVLYEVASFMVLRESVPWRWSHTRHHSDTIIVGRDPEIAVPRPPSVGTMILKCVNFQAFRRYVKNIWLHSTGRLNPEEATFIPVSEKSKVFLRARIYAAIYLMMFGLCIYYHTWLPFVFILGPNLYGAWLMPIYGWTQHAGLAENVLDHRLNCRTIRMDFINRFLYWNMNYHTEHHMFPLVPYHQLPKLHELIKHDLPEVYPGIIAAYREIIPTVLRQVKDPGYYIKRKLPTPSVRNEGHAAAQIFTAKGRVVDGWVEICASTFLKNEDVLRFDHAGKTYAVYRLADGSLHATDGICTHGNTHLADGLVKRKLIECPKHNGRFDVTNGSPQRLPVCVALKTYKVQEREGNIFLDLNSAGGCGVAKPATTYKFRVVSNENVATFIKELVLEPEAGSPLPQYQPGDYMQVDIPAYGEIKFSEIAVKPPFDAVWKAQHVFDYRSENAAAARRNYSLATNPAVDKQLRFNVRISTPPRGQDCLAGAGSAYVHRLKPGDTVTAIGPFGTFHIKPGDAEMIYVGGGAGMAPLRSHISHLFDTLKTGRKVSFWYGARSRQEVFYRDYFENLARQFPNFTFHLALSEPQPEDNWNGPTGFIHEVLRENYLKNHTQPARVEFYLCGPPAMVQATTKMLGEFDVPETQIAFDEF